MSKLVDLLSKAGEQSPAPLGFGLASRRQESSPQIVVVARAIPGEMPGKQLAEVRADAFLIGPESAEDPKLGKLAKQLEGRIWGVRLVEFNADQVRDLKEKGCDFIVFESMSTEAGVLNEEEVGVVATVDSELGELATRAIGELPLDAVLFSPPQRDLPLTVEKLIDIQVVVGLVDRPRIVEAPMGLGQEDLQALRDLGIAGVIVDIPPADVVATVKEAIDNLPRPKRRPTAGDALVPHATPPSPEMPAPDDDGDEDDDEDY